MSETEDAATLALTELVVTKLELFALQHLVKTGSAPAPEAMRAEMIDLFERTIRRLRPGAIRDAVEVSRDLVMETLGL